MSRNAVSCEQFARSAHFVVELAGEAVKQAVQHEALTVIDGQPRGAFPEPRLT